MDNENLTPLHKLPANYNERLSNERRWTDEAAEACLSAEDYMEWITLRSTHRMLVHPGKRLLIWEDSTAYGVVIDEILTVQSVFLDSWDGMSCFLRSENGEELQVTHAPTRISDGIFLWMPYYSDVQFVRRGSDDHRLFLPLMCRMPFNPSMRVKDSLHISEPRYFQELWPDVELPATS